MDKSETILAVMHTLGELEIRPTRWNSNRIEGIYQTLEQLREEILKEEREAKCRDTD